MGDGCHPRLRRKREDGSTYTATFQMTRMENSPRNHVFRSREKLIVNSCYFNMFSSNSR